VQIQFDDNTRRVVLKRDGTTYRVRSGGCLRESAPGVRAAERARTEAEEGAKREELPEPAGLITSRG
jgi:hypothetical protein